ncbi:MAG: pilus assembly protein TadG-related protein [Alphaproteobacteria bacterium]
MATERTLKSLAHRLVQLLKDRDGGIVVIVAGCLTLIVAFTALAIDMSYAYYLDNRLQIAADSSALAGVSQLADTNGDGIPDNQAYTEAAIEYAYKNMAEVGHGTIIDPACGTYDPVTNSVSGASDCDDVKAGIWDSATRSFTPWNPPSGKTLNAVRVRTHRAQATGNPFSTYFAAVLGLQQMDINSYAIAEGSDSLGPVTRFLIDDEMLDTDVLAIEDLAAASDPPVTTEELLTDGDGDWFIDLPPGTILELPTGQVGDEALFELTYDYQFDGSPGYPSHQDFLNWNEDSNSWRYDLVPKSMLDPMVGVEEVDNANYYWDYVSSQVQVSPVYKSDTSALNDYNGMPAVNALGWRRGLLAFKILGLCMATYHPDAHADCKPEYAPPLPSYLPNLMIEVVDPTYISGSLYEVEAISSGKKYRLVD